MAVPLPSIARSKSDTEEGGPNETLMEPESAVSRQRRSVYQTRPWEHEHGGAGHTSIDTVSPPKGLNYRQTVAITLQSKSVTVTPLGIGKSVTVSEKLSTVSLHPNILVIRRAHRGEFGKCHSKQ